ncbi:MAG: DUF4838 domain-containing protein [Planctomycetes bacterium]|nr:DUF4838 domain-containing protein [Planctomycetota bacterium]
MSSGILGTGFVRATLATLVLAAVASCTAADVTLVQDGKSDYVVVLPAEASPSEKWAAEELVNHVKEMSGATLPVQTAGAEVPEKAIVLGFGDAAKSVGVEADTSLGSDGFIIRTVGSRLVIAGSRVRGTLYGVYTLLDSLGIRWWYPGETLVPKAATITIPETDDRQVPKLEYRDMMFLENFNPQGKLWGARNRVNGMAWQETDEKLGGWYRVSGNLVHSYNSLLDASGVKMTDAMWAQRDGKPQVRKQPCLSNPDVLAAVVKAVIAQYKADPNLKCVVVGQEDNRNFCQCDACAAVDKEQESNAGQVITFANKVAEQVEKEIPNAKILTAAYEWSRKPPKTLKPRDNVYITLCSIECDFAHPLAAGSNPENKAFKDDIEGWGKIARKIFIWHYVGNRDHYLMPNAEIETLVPNTKFFADNGCAGIFNQGMHRGSGTDMAPLKMWLLARAMWNPEADSRKLIEEFCNGFYGPAGPAMLKYLDAIHSVAHKREFHNGRRVHLDVPYLAPEIVAQAETALREAEKAVAGKPEYERRVRHGHMGIWYVLTKRGPGTQTWQAVEAAIGEKLDPIVLAANLAQVVKDWKINCICDPIEVDAWIDWAGQYAALVKEKGGLPVPPELADKALSSYRLIQACQFDMFSKWWAPAEGASDGWAAHVPSAGWHTQYGLSPWEDFTAGKQYKLCVRAKGELKDGAEGEVWEFGVYPKGKTVRVTAEQLKDSAWHVFELGPWAPVEGQYFWTALKGSGAKTVSIDCLWIEEVHP